MKNLREIILTKVYRDIQKGKMTEAVIFKSLETYFKITLTEQQKESVREYARQIHDGEMTLEEFIALCMYKEHRHDEKKR